MTSSTAFWFMVDFEQSGTRSPDAWSTILTFSIIDIFYLTNSEKNFKIALILLLWVKVLFLPKNADISKRKEAQVLKGIFFETTYLCVLT